MTLKEYLTHPPGGLPTDTVANFSGDTDFSSHALAAECCMRYLLLADFRKLPPLRDSHATDTSSDSSDSFDIDKPNYTELGVIGMGLATLFRETHEGSLEAADSIADRHELYDYAARFWAFHYAKIQNTASGAALIDLALSLYSRSHRHWMSYLWSVDKATDEIPDDAVPISVASFFGHENTISSLMTGSVSEHDAASAVYWAAVRGQDSSLNVLFSNAGINASLCSYRGNSALAIAAANGHPTCVEFLLSTRKFDVNELGMRNRTPLSLAAGGSHEAVIRTLFREEEINVNLPDGQGSSPLFWAVATDSVATIRLFLGEDRTNVNHVDISGRNALSWTCSYGLFKASQLLIHDTRIDVDCSDSTGKTPLIYATIAGSIDIVRALAKSRRVNLFHQDLQGRNALSWAAESADSRVLSYLLRHAPSCATAEDHNGWAPVAWTLNPPGYVANASSILKTAPEAAEQMDYSGRSLLTLAISWGQLDIAGLLISSGRSDLNSRDNTGRTALSHAAEKGYTDLVQRLVQTGRVDTNLADHSGLTPWSFAAASQHNDICDLLEAYGAPKSWHHSLDDVLLGATEP